MQCHEPAQTARSTWDIASTVASALVGAWLITFAVMVGTPEVYWHVGLVALWFTFNFASWLVPRWKLSIISRRGPSIGIGYALAAGLMSALALSPRLGPSQLILAVIVNTFLLALPFVASMGLKVRPGRPHWLDLAVTVYLLSMPAWWFYNVEIVPHAPLATFVAIASATTYFLGVRFWSRSTWEWTLRRNDAPRTLIVMALVGVVVWFDPMVQGGREAASGIVALHYGSVLAPLVALLVFGVAQAVFRELLKRQSKAMVSLGSTLGATLMAFVVVALLLETVSVSPLAMAIGGGLLARNTRAVLPAVLTLATGFVLFAVAHGV